MTPIIAERWALRNRDLNTDPPKTTTVNDIEHTESVSFQAVAVNRVFFQPSVKVEVTMSQITAVVQTILRVLPPGTFPPNIIKYDASSVPILQLACPVRTYSWCEHSTT
jgi:multidrug efflux pump subunit AcrB